MSALVLAEAGVIDPRQGIDRAADVLIRDGRIAELIAPRPSRRATCETSTSRAVGDARLRRPALRAARTQADLTAALRGRVHARWSADPHSEPLQQPEGLGCLRAAPLTKRRRGRRAGRGARGRGLPVERHSRRSSAAG